MKVKGLNDAKYIAVIVYITTIVLSVTLVTSFALSSYVNIYASINSTGIWASATVILGLMFIPKVVHQTLCLAYTIDVLILDGETLQGSRR